MAAARIQRWTIILSAYDYHIEYCPSEKHSNVDGLLRFPLPDTTDVGTAALSMNVHALIAEHFEQAPLNADQVARVTRRDKVLSKVLKYVMEGWPVDEDKSLKAYHSRKYELFAERGCVLWGTRVILADRLRKSVLNELHVSHQGIIKMKSLAPNMCDGLKWM